MCLRVCSICAWSWSVHVECDDSATLPLHLSLVSPIDWFMCVCIYPLYVVSCKWMDVHVVCMCVFKSGVLPNTWGLSYKQEVPGLCVFASAPSDQAASLSETDRSCVFPEKYFIFKCMVKNLFTQGIINTSWVKLNVKSFPLFCRLLHSCKQNFWTNVKKIAGCTDG